MFNLKQLLLTSLLLLGLCSVAQADTLRAIHGCETGSLVEITEGTTGAPSCQNTTVLTGSYSLQLAGSATTALARFDPDDNNTTAPTHSYTLMGFAFQASDVTPTSQTTFAYITSAANSPHCGLALEADGDLVLIDANGSTTQTVTAPFSINTRYYIELACFRNDTTGTSQLWINGTSQGTTSSQDYFQGTNDNVDSLTVSGPGSGDGNWFFDDIYFVTDASAQPTQLSNGGGGDWVQVFGYQTGNASTTSDSGYTSNDSSPSANWDNAGEQPLSEVTQVVFATDPSDGAVAFNDTATNGLGPGPSGDSNIDGTILGAKWWIYAEVGGGGSSTHTLYYGNSGDLPISSQTMTGLGAGATNNQVTLASGTAVPTSSDYLAMGGGVSGPKALEIEEMYAYILHRDAAAAARTYGTLIVVE